MKTGDRAIWAQCEVLTWPSYLDFSRPNSVALNVKVGFRVRSFQRDMATMLSRIPSFYIDLRSTVKAYHSASHIC